MTTTKAYGELGAAVSYDSKYNPKRLFAIPRDREWAFSGIDLWNNYEVSWLDAHGKPVVGLAQIIYDATSPCLVESKSLKLYFNSLNFTRFESVESLRLLIERDLSKCLETEVVVRIMSHEVWAGREVNSHFEGFLVDNLEVACSEYETNPTLLEMGDKEVETTLCSDLLRSNCPVTNQPDWGSVQVTYKGREIKPESFLKYIVSYRNHQGFHEQCIEEIFMDIYELIKPEMLTVYGRYTRRGGIDINPYRSTQPVDLSDARFRLELMRQ